MISNCCFNDFVAFDINVFRLQKKLWIYLFFSELSILYDCTDVHVEKGSMADADSSVLMIIIMTIIKKDDKHLQKKIKVFMFIKDIRYLLACWKTRPCRVGLVVSVSASHTVGHDFASRPGHTKDHHKNGTNCLPAWHAMR